MVAHPLFHVHDPSANFSRTLYIKGLGGGGSVFKQPLMLAESYGPSRVGC